MAALSFGTELFIRMISWLNIQDTLIAVCNISSTTNAQGQSSKQLKLNQAKLQFVGSKLYAKQLIYPFLHFYH
jgi:hypothetical protein